MSNPKDYGEKVANPSGIRKTISLMEKTGRIIDAGSGALSVICIALMTGVVLIGVFFRYVVGNPFMWTEELARFFMLWSGFLAINIAMRQGKHIRIDFIFNALPFVIRKSAEYLMDLLMVCFLVFLIKKGYDMTSGTIMQAMSLNISMSWIYVAVPLGALLTLIQLVFIILQKTLPAFDRTGKNL